ncbi:hypothetical protein EVC37_24600 [Methylocaldum sp. BRCS4]|nr:hypothetical protein [Methylocaldum sp. BRCS4]
MHYHPDPVGRLIGLWAPNFDTFGLAYDAGGRLTELRYPNGVTETLAWNADDSLQRLSHKNGASTLAQSTYTYDGLGRRKTLQETVSGLPTLTYTYQYDPLDRLTQVDNGTACQKQTYAYDIFGNRVQKQLGNPVSQTTAYQYDPAQQLTEVRNGSLTGTLLEADLYDEVGQLTQKCTGGTVTRPNDSSCSGSQVTQYAWTSFDRLGQITGAASASFRYDDQGRRIQKTEGGVATNYLHDGANLYGEYPAGGWTAPNALYVHAGLDHPLARLTGSVGSPSATAHYYHPDGLGSVLALTNASATVTATQRFDAFGQKLSGSGTVPQYGYTGREPDATGLIYYRARYYDPSVGRFTQRDPVGYLDGLNRYAYVGNNPVNFTDPNGLLARRVAAWLDTQTGNYFSSGQFADTLGRTVDAFGAAAQGNPLLGLSAAPAVGITQGIQAGSVPQIGFEVATTELPGLKASVGLVGAIIKSGSKIEPVVEAARGPLARGRDAETRVLNELGLPKNTQKVGTAEGNAIPDALTDTLSIEIKDAARVSRTTQVRIQTDAARRDGRESVLITGEKTCVSGNCTKAFDQIIRRPDLGPQ